MSWLLWIVCGGYWGASVFVVLQWVLPLWSFKNDHSSFSSGGTGAGNRPGFRVKMGETGKRLNRNERKFSLNINKYSGGNLIYQNVLEIRLMIIKCDLTDDPYTAFLVPSFLLEICIKLQTSPPVSLSRN